MNPEWESWKDTIHGIYLGRDQTLEYLINEMGSKHGFWKTSVKFFENFSMVVADCKQQVSV
jgi:hypothetical protein